MSKLAMMMAVCTMSAAPGAAITYSDRPSFLAAIGGPATTITFDGIVGTPGFAPYTSGGYFSGSGYTLGGVQFTGIEPFFRSYIFDAVSEFSLAGSASGMFDQFGGDFTLSPGTTAFGLDLGAYTGTGNVQVTVQRARAPSVATSVSLSGAATFFGFTGNETITSVNVRDPGNTAYYVKFDNVSLGNLAAGALPEPGTWAMLLIGFAGVGAVARRKRRGQTVAA